MHTHTHSYTQGRVALYRIERVKSSGMKRGGAAGKGAAAAGEGGGGGGGWRAVLVAQRDMAGPVSVLQVKKKKKQQQL